MDSLIIILHMLLRFAGSKSIFGVVTVLFLLIVSPQLITGHNSTLQNIEQSAKILDSLERLGQSNAIKQDEDLLFIYNKSKIDLREFVQRDSVASSNLLSIWNNFLSLSDKNSILKFFSSSLLWVVLLVSCLLKQNLENRKSWIAGLLSCVIVFGMGAFAIPNFTSFFWLDTIVIPFAVFSLLPFLLIVYAKKNETL